MYHIERSCRPFVIERETSGVEELHDRRAGIGVHPQQ